MVVEARISDYLRTERKELKEYVVAEIIGITQSRFSAIMNGKASMKLDEFMRLCKFLNEEPNKFIRYEEKRIGGEYERSNQPGEYLPFGEVVK